MFVMKQKIVSFSVYILVVSTGAIIIVVIDMSCRSYAEILLLFFFVC